MLAGVHNDISDLLVLINQAFSYLCVCIISIILMSCESKLQHPPTEWSRKDLCV
jgi:hypothetical protein